MSVEQTKRTMKSYFTAMGAGEDFSRFYTGDVRWIMVDSGQQMRGPSEVRDYILALHSKMFDHRQRGLWCRTDTPISKVTVSTSPTRRNPDTSIVWCTTWKATGSPTCDATGR
jgi:hypothetical protein